MDQTAKLHEEIERLKILIAQREKEITSLKNRVPMSSLDGLVIVDPTNADFPIVFTNQVFEKITGYSFMDVVGKNCRILQGSDHNQPSLVELKQAINFSKECRVVLKNYKKDGTLFWNELTIIPSFNAQNRLVSYAGIIHDVTKEKEIDRMKTEFISLASHQLRTPLSAIKWFCELLGMKQTGQLNPKQTQYVSNITQSTQRLIDLVNSLLNVSRIESGRLMINPVPTKLKELVNLVYKELYPQIMEKQINFLVFVDPMIPEIKIDPGLIRQVFMNLMTNAIKYTPTKGVIRLQLSLRGDHVLAIVKDNGLGIPKKDQEKLFQKFFRAQNAVLKVPDGNGLGLYLVKSIVDGSGGKIWFESQENAGTTFYFTLPVVGMNQKEGEVALS